MPEIYLQFLPVFMLIFSGFALRKFGVVSKNDSSPILQVVFYFSLPALILANIPNTELNPDFVYLPLVPVLIGLVLFFLAKGVSSRLNLEPKTLGVFIISALIMNTAFAIPFSMAFLGKEGLAGLLIFDMGNALFIYGFAYFQACKYGNHSFDRSKALKRVLKSVPLWSVFIAVVMNLAGIRTEGVFLDFLSIAGALTIPLLLLSVGILFEPKLIRPSGMIWALIIRMGFGLLLGFVFIRFFGLSGVASYVVILATATPVGYNTLTFSSLEKLDTEFAAALISVSILISLVYIPLIVLLFF
jgi:malate permease and related proteins